MRSIRNGWGWTEVGRGTGRADERGMGEAERDRDGRGRERPDYGGLDWHTDLPTRERERERVCVCGEGERADRHRDLAAVLREARNPKVQTGGHQLDVPRPAFFDRSLRSRLTARPNGGSTCVLTCRGQGGKKGGRLRRQGGRVNVT